MNDPHQKQYTISKRANKEFWYWICADGKYTGERYQIHTDEYDRFGCSRCGWFYWQPKQAPVA